MKGINNGNQIHKIVEKTDRWKYDEGRSQRSGRNYDKCIAKLGKNEHISTQVLEKICNVLHCEIQDIMDFVPDDEMKGK